MAWTCNPRKHNEYQQEEGFIKLWITLSLLVCITPAAMQLGYIINSGDAISLLFGSQVLKSGINCIWMVVFLWFTWRGGNNEENLEGGSANKYDDCYKAYIKALAEYKRAGDEDKAAKRDQKDTAKKEYRKAAKASDPVQFASKRKYRHMATGFFMLMAGIHQWGSPLFVLWSLGNGAQSFVGNNSSTNGGSLPNFLSATTLFTLNIVMNSYAIGFGLVLIIYSCCCINADGKDAKMMIKKPTGP